MPLRMTLHTRALYFYSLHQAKVFYARYNSAEYTPARKLRETASRGIFILVQGFNEEGH
jgi:uncharacterized protein (DUF1330 family)